MNLLKKKIEPLLTGQLHKWHGLPVLLASDLEASLGESDEEKTVNLGAYPAQRLVYKYPDNRHEVIIFTREGGVVMIEVNIPINVKALDDLPEPSVILPEEIFVAGVYSHEYVYADRGLLLTVAQPLGQKRLSKIIRCRGIRVLSSANELGPELYVALENKIKW